MDALIEPIPENPSDSFLVLDRLQEIGVRLPSLKEAADTSVS
jgi:hypothetical protein